MTTTVKVNCNGNYVATVKINGEEVGTVGPGIMVEKAWSLRHDVHPNVFEVDERPATAEEVEAAKAP